MKPSIPLTLRDADQVCEIARLALRAASVRSFHESLLDATAEWLIHSRGAIATVHDNHVVDAACTVDSPVAFAEALTAHTREASPDEVTRSLQDKTHRYDTFYSELRRNELSLFRAYLRPRDAERCVFRAWPTARGYRTFFLSGGVDEPWGYFAERATALLDLLFPVIALAEKQFVDQRECEDSAVSSELSRLFSLTPAECDALNLLLRGLTNPEIGAVLKISANTVRNRLSAVFRKLGVSTRTEACFVLSQALRTCA